ncbi:PREDICTED: transcription factor SPT20 homolog [Bactrocera latifrons]|nr:PREDICTED: transcription factor SPT20 homolog [Bactrocera latifrons]XP_018788248.1 PREDICTED: transcription factor SPT20 homolog [Bactrocera latifrons]
MSQKSSARLKLKRRSGEQWVSTNRVLNSISGSKKACSIGRNPNFDTDETKLLIQLWGDPKVQRTLIIAHKKHAVLCDLAAKMQQYGYYRSPEEISTRVKNLKCFYNRLKKEIESGLASAAEPTWKHYAEMDAIMKRPIFSVRPNEVPPPSLKYQLEKAREEREERRQKILEEGGTVSESDDGLDELVALSNGNASKNDIDDGIIPDVEVDINDEAFAAIASAAEKTAKPLTATKRRKISKASDGSLELCNEYGEEHIADTRSTDSNDMGEVQIKEENDSMDSEEFPLCKAVKRKSTDGEKSKLNQQKKQSAEATTTAGSTLIKEEPIDVDAEEENGVIATQKNTMPTLIERLGDNSSSIVLPVSSPMTIASTAANASKATTTTTSSTQSTPQGKISLVPTNFLMQPKPTTPTATTPTAPAPAPLMPLHQSQIQLLPNALNTSGTLQPGRILLSGTASVAGAQGTPTSAGFVATGPGGMKLLLVNADQAGAQMAATNTTLGKSLLPQINAALLQQQQQQQQKQQQQQQAQQQQQLQQQQQQQEQQAQQLQKEQQQKQQQLLKKVEEAKVKAANKRQQKQLHDKQRREELLSRKEAASMRILLRHIYNAQTENNEIQQQRLALERERFDFERSAVDRFFAELPKLFTQQQQQQQQQTQVLQQQQQQVAAAMQAHTQQMRLNPPKLVFTTAVPGGASIAGVTGGATILTPTKLAANALPKLAPAPTAVIAQTPLTVTVPAADSTANVQSVDVQLVTPKTERED